MIIADSKALPKFQSLAADNMLLSISQATIKENISLSNYSSSTSSFFFLDLINMEGDNLTVVKW